MSNNPEYDEVSPVADEPIQSSARKSVPPLNGEAHVERAGDGEISKSKRIMRASQSLTIIIALILSVYSFTVIDGINESTDDDENADVILLRTEGREADHICSAGGADILIGNDSNNNGILEEEEVTSTTRLCHGDSGFSGPPGATGATGPSGESGYSSLVITSVVENGNETCVFGGILISTGLDTNRDGNLAISEVIDEEYVCNGVMGINGNQGQDGSDGHSALVERLTPPAYLCSDGFILNFGVDNGAGEGLPDDGIMHEDEVVESLKICSEPLIYGPATDFSSGITNSYSNQCANFAWSSAQSMVITAGSNGLSGCELWTSHGTEDSAELLLDINPGGGDSTPGLHLGFTSVNLGGEELWLFDADSGVNGRELWVSDLTPSGTLQLTGYSGDGILSPSVHTEWMNGLIFSDSNFDFMWTDGNSMYNLFDAPFIGLDEQMILDSVQNKISSHSETNFAVDNSGLWFSGIHDDLGFEMHHLSNTGELISWDLNTFEDSSPSAILPFENTAVVVAEDGINGRQLVELGITGSHTWLTSMSLQSNGNPPTSVGENLGLNLLNDQIIFDAQITNVDPTVWSYNFTTGAVTELSSVIVAPSQLSAPVIQSSKIWFDCITATTAQELCVSDGTVDGTKMIHEFQPGMASAEIRGLVAVEGHLLIIANGEVNGLDTGHCLWSIDVVTLAANIVYDPWTGVGNNSDAGTYGAMINSGELILFVADDGTSGHELHMWSPLSLTDEWLIW
ncbi:MAG: hypothetical protein VX043_00815 [Candidatus Thermoplasmatota archaeon]|nr:hypothetical protein [Candidatus Thermoplasmatota archaeon]